MMYTPNEPYIDPSSPFSNIFVPRSAQVSAFDEICTRPGTRIEDLLDDENFIVELKNNNPNLVDFLLKKPEQIKTLVEFITVLPPNMYDNKRAYQYPLIASQIFDEDVSVIMNAFFKPSYDAQSLLRNSTYGLTFDSPISPLGIQGSELYRLELLNQLFNFLNTKNDLNDVLSGYFFALVSKLVRRNPTKMIEYVFKDTTVYSNIVEHISNHSISDLIPLFLLYDISVLGGPRPEILTMKVGLIDLLFKALKNLDNPDNMAHISEVIFAILIRQQSIADGKELVTLILSKEYIDQLFSTLKYSQDNNVVMPICNVILTILHFYITEKAFVSTLFNTGAHDPVVASLHENIETLSNILQNRRGTEISTTFSDKHKAFGLGKLKILQLFELIVRIESLDLNFQLHDKNVVKTLTDIFEAYPWNNLVHVHYYNIVHFILDRKGKLLLQSLFAKAHLHHVILQELQNDSAILPRKKGSIRKGNLGFVLKLGNEIAKCASEEPQIKAYLSALPGWDSFVVPTLEQRRVIEEIAIGGHHPRDLLEQAPPGGFSNPDFAAGYVSPQADQQPGSFTSALQMRDSLTGFDLKNLAQPTESPTNSPNIHNTVQNYISDQLNGAQSPSTQNDFNQILLNNSLPNNFDPNIKTDIRDESSSPTKLEPNSLSQKPFEQAGDIYGLRVNKSLSEPDKDYQSPEIDQNTNYRNELRKSISDFRAPSSLKLKVKRSEKSQGKKLVEMISNYQGAVPGSGVEFSFSESSKSECENLDCDESELL